MKYTFGGIIAVLVAAVSTAASADTIVTPTNNMGWTNPTTENSGGGYSAITGRSAYNGNGSIELHGDRTRFVYGDLYSPGPSLGSLSNFTNLAFSYRIDPTSTNAINPGYSPALRMTFWSNATRDEFVFEQAYQPGGYGAEAPIGSWNTTTSSSTFYLRSLHNESVQHTLADWVSMGNFGNAYVSAVYIGVGSGIGGANYLAYADNVKAGSNTYNFEASANGAVPEPATWAMMLSGFGLAGFAMRRRSAAMKTVVA